MGGVGGVAMSFAKAKHHFEVCLSVSVELGEKVAPKAASSFSKAAAANLEAMDSKAPLLGARVLVGGLEEKVHFNGLYGTAVDFSYLAKHPFPAGGQWDVTSGRYEVELDAPERKRILVRPEKVTGVEPAGVTGGQGGVVSQQQAAPVAAGMAGMAGMAGDGGGRDGEQGGGGKRRKTSSTI